MVGRRDDYRRSVERVDLLENSIDDTPKLAMVRRHQRQAVVKVSRPELSVRSGVSAAQIKAIEDGVTVEPGVFTVAALAIALDLDLTDLMRQRAGRLRSRRLSALETHRSTTGGGS